MNLLMLLPLLHLLFLLFFFNFFTYVSAQCRQDQRDLLLELKNSLSYDSSSSTKLARWSQAEDCCKWAGVECDGKGYASSLDLTSESISGGIDESSSLFRLVHLRSLSLAQNSLGSTDLPRGFGKLEALEYLNLSSAGFSGQIPADVSYLGSGSCQEAMTALVQLRPQSRDLGVLMMDDEDLAIDLVGLRNEITDDDDSFLPPLEQPRTVDNEWLMAEYDPSVLSSVENKELLQVVISEPSDSTSEEPAASPPPSKPKSSSSSSSSRPSMHTVIRRQTPPPSKTKPSTPSSRSTLPSLSKPKPYRTAAWKPLPSSRSSTPARKAAPTAACKNPMPSSSSKPLSESRGRPRSSTNSTFSSPDSSNGKPLRRKSCPHAKPRSPSIGNKTRGHGNDAEVSPVVMGTKMVERVVNMRKLVAPPKQADERAEDDDDKRPNKVSARKDKGSSGFGRSLSSKSLDMAIRHMDIRKSIPENLRPVETSCVKPRTAAKSCDVTESSPSPPSSLWSGNDISKYCV